MSDSWAPDGSIDVAADVDLDWLLDHADDRNGHEGLLSSLSGHDLAFAQDAREAAGEAGPVVEPEYTRGNVHADRNDNR